MPSTSPSAQLACCPTLPPATICHARPCPAAPVCLGVALAPGIADAQPHADCMLAGTTADADDGDEADARRGARCQRWRQRRAFLFLVVFLVHPPGCTSPNAGLTIDHQLNTTEWQGQKGCERRLTSCLTWSAGGAGLNRSITLMHYQIVRDLKWKITRMRGSQISR